MLSSCEEAWEGERRSKSFTYCIKVETPGTLISSRSVLKAFKKYELSVKPWGIAIQVFCCPSQVTGEGIDLFYPLGY